MARTVMCKLLQKRAYDVLSKKHTIIFLFVGIIIVIVAVLQFGEALLEWSTERYGAMFYPFSDNIAGKSFHKMLCQHVPIDIVYTWVNGSDPKHIEGLARAKEEYGFTQRFTNSCSLGLCIESHMVLVRPSLPKTITLSDLEEAEPLFDKVTDNFAVSSSSSHVNATVLVFSSIDNAKQFAYKTNLEVEGKNYSIFPGFVTDNWFSQDTVTLKNTFIILNTAPNGTEQNLIDSFPPLMQKSIKKVYMHKDMNAAIVTVTSDDVLFNSYSKANKTAKNNLSISNANLVVDFSSDHEDVSASRFTDNEELRYSLRSVEKHAPWVQHIYIVTNGQIPSWLNLDNPRISIITHEDIFPNRSHLPTFSSPAIECHLHRIPNLSKKFLYLNDDVMFGKDVWPEDFYTHTKGQKVYLSWPVPNCADGCPSSWIRDGYCDKPCNNSMCQWDGGDCTVDNPLLPQQGALMSGSSDPNPLLPSMQSSCHEECVNTWLADRYCDKACNVFECGFDVGDCGVGNYHQLFQLHFTKDKVDYQLSEGERIGFFNLSELAAENFTVKDAFYDDVPIVRTMAVSTKHNVLTFVLHPNHNITRIKIVLRTLGWIQIPDIVFYLTASTILKPVLVTASDLNVSTEISFDPIFFEEFAEEEKYPKILPVTDGSEGNYARVNLSASVLPEDIIAKILDLHKMLLEGEITEKGYWKKKSLLINECLKYHQASRNTTVSLVYLEENDLALENESFAHLFKNIIKKRSLLQSKDDLETNGHSNFVSTIHDSESTRSDGLKTKNHEVKGLLNYLILKASKVKSDKIVTFKSSDYETPVMQTRQLLDTFGDSLRHANKLYNEAFGYEARKVPSHIAHFVDRDVMTRLNDRFYDAFDVTSSHRVRSSTDMQFAFSYYYYLMSEVETVSADKIFDVFDIDKSGTWSDREIRTLLTRLNDLPLDYSTVNEFEQNIINCSKEFEEPDKPVTTPHYERYYKSDLPLVSKQLIMSCQPITTLLLINFGQQKRNLFEVVGEEEVAFKMIHNNLSHVLMQIDDIRKNPKKFVCLNDNIKHGTQGAEMIRVVIQDFYESFFPTRSQFELPADYRNRFLYMDELKEWRKMRDIIRFATYLCLGLLIVFSLSSFWNSEVRPQISRRRVTSSNRRRSYQV